LLSFSLSKLQPENKNLVLIVGPTGVGKSATAFLLARTVGGEIISCDSMQVYRGFDIGTDKPPAGDRRIIPYHLLDILDGSTPYTAADFAAGAFDAILAILGRNRVPIVVGGTGLYLKALLDGLFPGPGRDESLRRALAEEAGEHGLEALFERLKAADPAYAAKIGPRDRVRIFRALEVQALTGIPLSAHFARTESRVRDFAMVKIGLRLEIKELYRRIESRVDRMFEQGLVREVESRLSSGVAEGAPPFRALGYRHVLRFLKKEITLAEAVTQTKIDTRHYAKRQMTWFRKMPGIRWFSPDDFGPILEFVKGQIF
jgi:tRNA dimethylallyltransferase